MLLYEFAVLQLGKCYICADVNFVLGLLDIVQFADAGKFYQMLISDMLNIGQDHQVGSAGQQFEVSVLFAGFDIMPKFG